jgi:hypothetical protein
LRDDIECQFGNRCQSLAGVLFHIPDGVFFPESLDLLDQAFQLREK